MKNPEIPFSAKLTMAILAKNPKATEQIIAECIGTMTKKFLDVAHEYDITDLPFVVATMQIAARSLSLILNDSGRALADKIANQTECMAVNLNELKNQMKEKDDE